MRPVQHFSDDYLERCRLMSTEGILEYLEGFRQLRTARGKSRLISIKVPEPLLRSFRRKCELVDVKYQTQIKKLMAEWLKQPRDRGS